MLKKVKLYVQVKGGDGRYRPGVQYGAIEIDRITYLESVGTWYDSFGQEAYPITCIHFDDGTTVDVLMPLAEVMEMQHLHGSGWEEANLIADLVGDFPEGHTSNALQAAKEFLAKAESRV